MKVDAILLISTLILALGFQFLQNEKRQYFNGAFHPGKIVHVEERLVNFQDTIPNDTVYICFSERNSPLAIYREIRTGVCLEGVCLPVYLNIYWTVSGNYLGYQLGEGEVLTKNEHETFTEHDYEKLHSLLNDPQSLLANYTLAEIASGNTNTEQVDGVSGATKSDLRGYIIKGAAYTTHTLWHVVYGPSRDSVMNVSSAYASSLLLSNMISSSDRQDKIWAVRQFKEKAHEFPELIPKIQETIQSGDFYLKEQAIQSLINAELSDREIQIRLFEAFPMCDFGTKRMIINQLAECCRLNSEVVEKIVQQIPIENNAIANLLFTLLKESYQPEPFLVQKISLLLGHEKKYISDAAYNYLSTSGSREPGLEEKLKEYQNRY